MFDRPTESIYDFSAQRIDGRILPFSELRGQVLLIANTASQCGFTPQLKGLDHLYWAFKLRGLVVLGFPCNQFGGQEPGSSEQIQSFCEMNYGVRFPIFAKINVNGPDAHPLYRFLKASKPGIFGTQKIKWNFTKFLVNRSGKVVARYAPATKPEKMFDAIARLIGKEDPAPPLDF